MYLEIVGFIGIVCIALFFVAEWKNDKAIGIIAAGLLILLGLWLMTEQVQIKTQEIIKSNTNSTTDNMTGFTSSNTSSNTTYVYTPITTSQFNFNQTIGVIILAIGLSLGFKYAWSAYRGA